jgi:hypothetical protein
VGIRQNSVPNLCAGVGALCSNIDANCRRKCIYLTAKFIWLLFPTSVEVICNLGITSNTYKPIENKSIQQLLAEQGYVIHQMLTNMVEVEGWHT